MKRLAILSISLMLLFAGCLNSSSSSNTPPAASQPEPDEPAPDAPPTDTPPVTPPPEPEPVPLEPQELWNGTHDHAAAPSAETFTVPEGYVKLHISARSMSTAAVPKADDVVLKVLNADGKEVASKKGGQGSVILGEGSEVWSYEVDLPASAGDWTLSFEGIAKAETKVVVMAYP